MILLTAFEPFGKSALNASQEVARQLAETDDEIELLILPVTRYEAQNQVLERLRTGPAPRFYIALGEADTQSVIRLEKVAINWDDYRIEDNAGNQPRDEPISPNAPDAYFASLPVARIAQTLEDKTPLPVIVSLSAGSFLCNHLAFTVSEFLTATALCPFCFVHIPAWRPRYGTDTLEKIVQTIRAVLRTANELVP